MPAFDFHDTTDPSAPTSAQMEAMWLAARRAEQDEADRRSIALHRRVAAAVVYGRAA